MGVQTHLLSLHLKEFLDKQTPSDKGTDKEIVLQKNISYMVDIETKAWQIDLSNSADQLYLCIHMYKHKLCKTVHIKKQLPRVVTFFLSGSEM